MTAKDVVLKRACEKIIRDCDGLPRSILTTEELVALQDALQEYILGYLKELEDDN